MNPQDCAKLLGKCSAFDNRRPSEAAARVWAEAIHHDVSIDDALAAVSEHYASSTDYLGPAHINRIVLAKRGARLAAALQDQPDIPDGLSQLEEREWSRQWRRAVKDGRPDAVDVADRSVGAFRPALLAPDPVRVRQITALAASKAVRA